MALYKSWASFPRVMPCDGFTMLFASDVSHMWSLAWAMYFANHWSDGVSAKRLSLTEIFVTSIFKALINIFRFSTRLTVWFGLKVPSG